MLRPKRILHRIIRLDKEEGFVKKKEINLEMTLKYPKKLKVTYNM